MSRSTPHTFDDSKLRELILYVSEKCLSDEKYGAIKLNKILLAADVLSFRKHGRSISAAQYKSLPFGPAPVGMKIVMDKMEEDGELAIQETSYYGKPQKRPVNLRRADLSEFTGEDIALLNEVISDCRDSSATQLSNDSHGIAWELGRRTGKPIPLAAFLFKQTQIITPYHQEKYKTLAAERGW